MRTYVRYELDKRMYSSNALAGIRLVPDPNKPGKMNEKKDILFVCCLPKVEGDIFTNEMLAYYSSKPQYPYIPIADTLK